MSIDVLTDMARLLGGISLRNQEIREYKNGTKIILKKAYFNDGVLEFHKKYIIIIIPENES